MTRIYALILLVALGANCKHFGPGTPIGDCGKEVAASILPAIESALVSGKYKEELAELVGRFGICLVRNGVAHVVNQAKADVKFGAKDPNTLIKVERGTTWLEENQR